MTDRSADGGERVPTPPSYPRPDRFEFRRVLGKGGVGEVLLTWDRERGEEVALKFVRLAEAEADQVEAEKNGARLQMELATVAPHVPRVFEEGEDRDFYFFVMEYVAGKDLSDLLDFGPLPEDRAIRIAIQICDFLARLHSFTSEIGGRKLLGVIHGDIKPQNIRLQSGDRVRVIDFGIAKELSLSRSYTQNVFGSLPYLPPERLEHSRVDFQSDLWATTVVLYFMISGRLPYNSTTAGLLERDILDHQITPLPETCSGRMRWIINKGLSPNPQRRFSSGAAFRDELKKLLEPADDSSSTVDPLATTEVKKAPKEPAPSPDATKRTVPPPAEVPRTPSPALPPPAPQAAQEVKPAPVAPPPPIPQTAPEVKPPSLPAKRPSVRVRPAPSPVVSRKPATTPWRVPKALWAGLALVALLAVFQGVLWGEARRLHGELQNASLTDLLPLWQRYRWVTRLCLFDTAHGETDLAVKGRLRAAAEDIFDREREGSAPVTLDELSTACRYMETALQIGSQDEKDQARLFYCKGQEALAEAEQKTGQEAVEKRTEAAADFNRAAGLDESWPEPFLGLARGLVDGNKPDPDRFDAFAESARRRGFKDSRPFTVLLGDAYLAAGKGLVEKSRAAGGPEVKSLLWEAFRSLEQAVRRYDDLEGYGAARSRRSEAIELKNNIAGRLADLGGV